MDPVTRRIELAESAWKQRNRGRRLNNEKPFFCRKCRQSLSAVLLAAGLIAFLPANAAAETLKEALSAAYRNNPTLLAARANLRATDEGVNQALSGWRPTLSMFGNVGVEAERSNSTTVDRGQHRKQKSLTFKLVQSLYKGGRTLAATRVAENEVRAERARLNGTEQKVLLGAVTAYMNVVRDQAILKLNISNEQVLRRQLQATRDRFKVGEITRTDVYQAEARLAGSTADRIKAEGNLEISRAAYRNVIGRAPAKLSRPGKRGDLPAAKIDTVEAALKGNWNLLAADFDARAGRDKVDEIKGELLPSLDLNGSASRSLNAVGEDYRSDSYKAFLTLTVPLYQSGSVYSRLREARQKAAELRRNTDQARRDAVEAAARAWEGLQTTRARISSFKSQIKAAEVALEGVQREASVGSRTVLDVLDAEQELLNARVSFVGAQRDEVVAVFDLMGAMGRMTAKKMNLQVDLYDPRGHYRKVRGKWVGGAGSGEVTEEPPDSRKDLKR